MKERPAKVMVAAVLYFISSASNILLGLAGIGLSLFAKSFLEQFLTHNPLTLSSTSLAGSIVSLGAIFFVIFSLIVIGQGIVELFVGKGLLSGKKWSLVIAWIINGFGLLFAISSMNLIGLVWHGTLVYLLVFDKEVKAFFEPPQKSSPRASARRSRK